MTGRTTKRTSGSRKALELGLRKTAVRRKLKANHTSRRKAGARLEALYGEFHDAIAEALELEIPVTEIARLSGTNRQRIYDLKNDPARPPRLAESDTYKQRAKGGNA